MNSSKIGIANRKQWIPAVNVSLGLPSKWVFHLRHDGSGIRTGPISRKGRQIDVRNMSPDKTRLMKMQARNDKKYGKLSSEMQTSNQTQ